MKGNNMVFEFCAAKPLVNYFLELQLRKAEDGEIEEEDLGQQNGKVFGGGNNKRTAARQARIVTEAKIRYEKDITDKLAVGLWRSAALAELVEENLLTTLDLSRVIEEVRRLGGI